MIISFRGAFFFTVFLLGIFGIAAILFFLYSGSYQLPSRPSTQDPALTLVTTADHKKSVSGLKEMLTTEKDPARQERLRQALVAVAGSADISELRSLPQGEQIVRDVLRKEQVRTHMVEISKTGASDSRVAETLKNPDQPLAVKLAALEKLKGADPQTAIPILNETIRHSLDATVRATALHILRKFQTQEK